MQTRYYTANVYQILGFTTTATRTTYYGHENHEPGAGMVGVPPTTELLAGLLADAALDGWAPVSSQGWVALSTSETVVMCQTDTASLFFQRSREGASAEPTPAEYEHARKRGQEAALALPEWPRRAVYGDPELRTSPALAAADAAARTAAEQWIAADPQRTEHLRVMLYSEFENFSSDGEGDS